MLLRCWFLNEFAFCFASISFWTFLTSTGGNGLFAIVSSIDSDISLLTKSVAEGRCEDFLTASSNWCLSSV